METVCSFGMSKVSQLALLVLTAANIEVINQKGKKK